MSNEGGGTWPEQDAIDLWFKAHDLHFRNEILMVLKDEVTKPRIFVQKELEQSQITILGLEQKLEICQRDYNFMYDLQQAGEKEIKDLEQKNEALQARVKELEDVVDIVTNAIMANPDLHAEMAKTDHTALMELMAVSENTAN